VQQVGDPDTGQRRADVADPARAQQRQQRLPRRPRTQPPGVDVVHHAQLADQVEALVHGPDLRLHPAQLTRSDPAQVASLHPYVS
jgi:hypothetical protein